MVLTSAFCLSNYFPVNVTKITSIKIILYLSISAAVFASCKSTESSDNELSKSDHPATNIDSDHFKYHEKVVQDSSSEAGTDTYDFIKDYESLFTPLDSLMLEHGLTDILELDPSIRVDLKYAGTDNFLGRDVYQGLRRAYLQPDVAEMLVISQQRLQVLRPGYSLVVYDAARPRRIQQKMWDAVDAPFYEKVKFLANPANGSIHNFGAAVDVSILDPSGHPLDMGTPFDHMGQLAYPSLEEEMLEQGLLNAEQIANRKLLRQVMRYGGFWGIQTEWWHFNACTREEARQRYQIIE